MSSLQDQRVSGWRLMPKLGRQSRRFANSDALCVQGQESLCFCEQLYKPCDPSYRGIPRARLLLLPRLVRRSPTPPGDPHYRQPFCQVSLRKISAGVHYTPSQVCGPVDHTRVHCANMYVGVGHCKEDLQTLVKGLTARKTILKRWRQVRVLVIDEISMIDGAMFDKVGSSRLSSPFLLRH